MPGSNNQAVAEMRLRLILGSLRRVAWLDGRARAGDGLPLPPDSFNAIGEVCGSAVGLVVPGKAAPSLRFAFANCRRLAAGEALLHQVQASPP